MFRNAYAIASKFTWPVVLSRKTVGGKCSSQIGAYVVLNKDGWIITAHHIVDQFHRMSREVEQVRVARAQADELRRDDTIAPKERRKRLSKITKPSSKMTERCSAWWGRDEFRLVVAHVLESVDLAVGRLEPFDHNLVQTYPVIKDPEKDFDSGVSLCKLGFPFHQIKPRWDETREKFVLPQGALPLPRFPIEGILTRLVEVVDANAAASPLPFPLRLVETSSPGLRGQSGGPTFDTQGAVWAIQTKTMHWPLGFEPIVNGVKEHQFLNVGIGVHPATIIGLLRQFDIKFEMSAH